MSLRSLLQYNSATRQTSVSARFNFRYRPGSDLYIAYDELRADLLAATPVNDRRLVVKMSYLFSR